VLVAADYPLLEIVGTMLVFFAWVAWIWLAITVFADLFRRRDIGGWHKAAWVVLVIVLPFIGVLAYLIAQHQAMAERSLRQAEEQKAAFDHYVRETAGGSAAEIARAKDLLDQGAITSAEFDAIKARALAAG